jgi:hypothetical protein
MFDVPESRLFLTTFFGLKKGVKTSHVKNVKMPKTTT